ncbi:MAG: nuclear transport factor 2 family protein [Bacteroidota bacterium]
MPTLERVEEFIHRVETVSHDKVIDQFYSDDASIQENNSAPRIGKANLVKKEQGVLAKTKAVSSECIRPIFIHENFVIIRWKFCFEWLDGSTSEIEEIAYQRWNGELIQEEKFFYDPIQMKPK